MHFTVYMLRTSGNTLYIGQTNDIGKRIEQHRKKSGASAKYMRYFSSFDLVYTEQTESRGEALKREAALRRLTRIQKEALIQQYSKRVYENS